MCPRGQPVGLGDTPVASLSDSGRTISIKERCLQRFTSHDQVKISCKDEEQIRRSIINDPHNSVESDCGKRMLAFPFLFLCCVKGICLG